MFLVELMQNIPAALMVIAALIVGLTIHEYAHALVAYRSGDPTAKLMGRLTLNPLAHLDPIGTLFMFLVGFGWGKPVPINPHNFRKKEDEIKVALAGIAANVLLAFLLGIPLRFASAHGIIAESSLWLIVLKYMVGINLRLAVFNLLPVYPLDGSRLVEYLLRGKSLEVYQSIGPYLLLSLLFIDMTTYPIINMVTEPLLRFLSFLTTSSTMF